MTCQRRLPEAALQAITLPCTDTFPPIIIARFFPLSPFTDFFFGLFFYNLCINDLYLHTCPNGW